jgi:hypothetical protein
VTGDPETLPLRPLRQDEEALIRSMLSRASAVDHLAASLYGSQVSDMRDGGMGSIRFHPYARRMGSELVVAEALDDDGVRLSIALNLDTDGKIFELDIWKVDFSPLIRFPLSDSLIYR